MAAGITDHVWSLERSRRCWIEGAMVWVRPRCSARTASRAKWC